MWKKSLIIIASVIGLLMVVILILAHQGIAGSEGLFYNAADGSKMIIINKSPVVISDNADEKMFENLTDGDKIFVIHNGIAESYPGRTKHIYACLKIADGKPEDIAGEVVSSLQGLGWLGNEEEST